MLDQAYHTVIGKKKITVVVPNINYLFLDKGRRIFKITLVWCERVSLFPLNILECVAIHIMLFNLLGSWLLAREISFVCLQSLLGYYYFTKQSFIIKKDNKKLTKFRIKQILWFQEDLSDFLALPTKINNSILAQSFSEVNAWGFKWIHYTKVLLHWHIGLKLRKEQGSFCRT